MSDMLVKLYKLPNSMGLYNRLEESDIIIRNAIAPEKSIVCNWVGEYFSLNWKDECDVSFSMQPVSCIVATYKNEIIGFACYDATCKGFFGPTGVLEEYRGNGVGKALLLKALEGLRNSGYAYGIIGGVGPTTFYEKAVNAVLIPDSSPGIYKNLLKNK